MEESNWIQFIIKDLLCEKFAKTTVKMLNFIKREVMLKAHTLANFMFLHLKLSSTIKMLLKTCPSRLFMSKVNRIRCIGESEEYSNH